MALSPPEHRRQRPALSPKGSEVQKQDQAESEDMVAPSPARLESFSDGVIAVVLTIMVLNLRLPAHDGLNGLREMLPVIAIYLLSFAFTGIYWLNHQHDFGTSVWPSSGS